VSAIDTSRSKRDRSELRLGPIALTTPVAAGLLVFFAAPFITFVVYSFLTAGFFSVSGPFTLDAYRDAISTPINGTLAMNSLRTGLIAATVTVLVGLPIAYWLRYLAGAMQLPVLFVITASMFASYLVRIYAWRTLLGENGVINATLDRIGVIDQPLGFLLFSRFAVTVAAVHLFMPFVILTLYAGLRPLQPSFLEAAQDLGANGPLRWLRVILPLMAAPIATSFLFVFVLASSDWVTSAFLGGTSGQLLGARIATTFREAGNYPQGAALSLLTMLAFALCFVLVTVGLRLSRLNKIHWMS